MNGMLFRMRVIFWRDERGQATTEYILIIFAAVLFFIIVAKAIRPLYLKLADFLSRQLDSFFSRSDMHRLPIGR